VNTWRGAPLCLGWDRNLLFSISLFAPITASQVASMLEAVDGNDMYLVGALNTEPRSFNAE